MVVAATALALGNTLAVLEGLAALAVGGFVWLSVYRSAPRRAMRELKRAKHVPIGSVPEGVAVRVIGRIEAIGEPLVSPLSKRACVHFRVAIIAHDPMRQLDTVEARQPFTVVDDTGVAVVEPRAAVCVVNPEPAISADLNRLLDHTIGPFIDARRKPDWPRTVYLHEFVLECGATTAILGAATREPITDASAATEGYREGPRTQLRFASSPTYPLRISNDAAAISGQ